MSTTVTPETYRSYRGLPTLAGLASIPEAARPGLSVEQCVGRLKRLHYAFVRLHEVLTARITAEPIYELKTGFSHHAYLCAEHVSALRSRVAESFETALNHADGRAIAFEMDSGRSHLFSARFACPVCSFALAELEPRLFSFNNPAGACPRCDGLGQVAFFDPARVVAHPELSLAAGAIRGWDRRNQFYFQMLGCLAAHYGFDIETPVAELPDSVREIVLLPLVRIVPAPRERKRERARTVMRLALRLFVGIMHRLGVLTYEFRGRERLGRPGQLILPNHPSLIDVVFLLAFVPGAGCVVKGGLWRRVMMRPAAPNAAAERSTAPTLWGSVTWSSTMIGPAFVRAASSSSVLSGNGSVSSRAPWWTVSGPSFRSRSRGMTRWALIPRARMASASRRSAFSVSSSLPMGRPGLRKAASTAWMPYRRMCSSCGSPLGARRASGMLSSCLWVE